MQTTKKIHKYYGKYGGMFIPESLVEPINKLSNMFEKIKNDNKFTLEFHSNLKNYVGRETPLTEVKSFQKYSNGPRVFLKREDLLHTGAHKINNAIGQCLLARKMNKSRIIAETGAGQHGVATATACAKLKLECHIHMGTKDIKRQKPNVDKMKLLGAKIIEVNSGESTLKEAVSSALRDYASNFKNSHYCLGSALGPYPYPQMVEYFQSIIGEETKIQCQRLCGKDPDIIIACIGGDSNAIGIFNPFLNSKNVKLIGVEAGGISKNNGNNALRFTSGNPGVLHGSYSYVLQNKFGQIQNTHSISAGLDYPMVGPHHAFLHESKRVLYSSVTDGEALSAFKILSKTEGIIPALESSHALAYYIKEAKNFDKNSIVVINLSGRGDKDLPQLIMSNQI